MEYQLKTAYYKPDRQGVFCNKDKCHFAVEFEKEAFEDCGLLLYDKEGNETKIPASSEGKRGTLYGFEITGKGIDEYTYLYYAGEELFTDPYAKGITGLEQWGDFTVLPRKTKGRIISDDYDWEEDYALQIPYKDTIIYGLNVRGFTMHKSAGVKHKGTFEGIIQKIPYLKELGITCVELMPSYEFEECMTLPTAVKSIEEATKNSLSMKTGTDNKVNLWGFQKGFYFAPKASFAAQKPEVSFKNMVKQLHKNEIEVMMHFYFPSEVKHSYIIEVLKHWIVEYHLDGVRISGTNLPYQLIVQEPILKESKVWCDYFPIEDIYGNETPVYRNILLANGNFKTEMRRFLKGDENLVNQVIGYQRANPNTNAVVNALTDYDGFSLYDCVTYERKHNEDNGEENRDGTDYNYTWNCGIEGESRKKAIIELRIKQIKNALSMLFLSQGVPFLFAGDEFGNSRMGNNNAYCQDNEIGWIKWKENALSKQLLDFTKQLIAIRKVHPVLHQPKECNIMDTLGCGYPDISYHGAEAWRPDLSYISHMIGIMLCGMYIQDKEDNSFYIAYNMHWKEHELALPHLPKGMCWKKMMDTVSEEKSEETFTNHIVSVEGRSVVLFYAQADASYPLKKAKNKKRVDKENEGVETL